MKKKKMSKFDKLKNKLAKKPGIYDPAGLAAKIGREKLGKEKFQEKAIAGKKKAAAKRKKANKKK